MSWHRFYVRLGMANTVSGSGFGRFSIESTSQRRLWAILLSLAMVASTFVVPGPLPALGLTDADVSIVSPDAGEILDGTVTLAANVVGGASTVEFFYDPHEDTDPEISLGLAALNPDTGFYELVWDTTTVDDTYNIIDTDGDGIEDTTVNITKPPTHDQLRVVATAGDTATGEDAIDIRVQNMLTVRFTLPDNQEDLRGLEDLEAVVTSEFDIDEVIFDLYDITDADPDILTPFGEFESLGEPIENRHYGRPLGAPAFPTGSSIGEIGEATPHGERRWVFRGWDTTTVPDGTYLIVATATDTGGRTATYMVETYIVNDLRVVITAPDDGEEVSHFVALEARTSSLTGADNAAPGSLFPATEVEFTIDNGTDPAVILEATEIPSDSGRWRAVWDGREATIGTYTITAEAVNDNPAGEETATDTISVNLVAPGPDLVADFDFDWSNCHLFECSFLDKSDGGPSSWLWDFGDGTTSNDQNPTHEYLTYGVYTVTLGVDCSDLSELATCVSTHSVDIPVGNTGVVSFNRNDLDLEGSDEFIDWTSAFKNFDYTIGSTLAIPVMWETTVGSAEFASLPNEICDAIGTNNPDCVIFTPEEAFGTAPTVVGAADNGVLFTMEFTDVQFRGITDIFKGKANVRVNVDVDTDGDGISDQTNQLGTNVDVTNSGTENDEAQAIKIISPFEGEVLGGAETLIAGVVSTVTPDSVVFRVDGALIDGDVELGDDGWTLEDWATTSVADGEHVLTAVATIGGESFTSAPVSVEIDNAPPPEPAAPDSTFTTGRVNDVVNQYLTFPQEIEDEDEGEGGPPRRDPLITDASMTAEFSDITVIPGGGGIEGDLLEFDVTIENTSPLDSDIVLSAFAFQSKVSESPALGSRVGDKALYGQVVPGTLETTAASALATVKKNGTSQGLLPGEWKGICINSSLDYIPEFNSGTDSESLECGGNRADNNLDGDPELQTGADMLGLRPGESQTIRIRIDAGVTDGALHVVEPETLIGAVEGTEVTGPNGLTYFVPTIDEDFAPGCFDGDPEPGCVVDIPDFGDNKVLRDADGTFNPTFAPLADGLTFDNQIHLTLPRPNFAFTDIIGRNHTCETYGLTLGQCDPGHADHESGQPFLDFLDSGDLVPGVENFAAILRGYGEFHDSNGDFVPDINPDTGDVQPSYPYDVRCDNCGGQPYVPIAEFYVDNGDGSLTQSMVAGTYGDPIAEPYLAVVDVATSDTVKEEVFPEEEPGGPCDPIADPGSRKPACAQLGTSATGHFHSLEVVEGMGINGGDAVEFTIDITNTSGCEGDDFATAVCDSEAYLTAFNYQTKRRGLADIGVLDGYTQDRRDIRVDATLPSCSGLDDFACWNGALGIGQFPNVIGNGLLFGQAVWTDNDAGREGPVDSDQVFVDTDGIDPVPFQLESVKKNGPFTPILKGNSNFICVKSGLFDNDPDSDAACAGDPAILIDPNGELVSDNIGQRLGLPPGVTQSVRLRMEWGDFRGAMLQIAEGTLTEDNVNAAYGPLGEDTNGLARDFDCSDQRELEYCHPHNVGENIGYLPNTDAEWLTPETLEEIEYVIINQPGDTAQVMNLQQNFGQILAMAGFVPSAEFYAPDPNPDLVGTPWEGVLIRQQVLGEYEPTAVETPEVTAMISLASCNELGCDFDAAGSTSSTGSIESYEWDFGDGNTSSDPAPSHTYSSPGTYQVTLEVTSGGISATATTEVQVEEPPSEDPPGEDPPGEDPPGEDPPGEDPPGEDPPGEDPPSEDPPSEDPPSEDPPSEDPPSEDPPSEDPPSEDPPSEDPPGEDPPSEDPPSEDPPSEDPPSEDPPSGKVPDFEDIFGSIFEQDIKWLAAEGITKGCNPPDNTRYCPEGEVKRGPMAAFLNRFLDLPAASKDHFSDDDDSIFEDDINRLAEAGITKGCGDRQYCPDDVVDRGQIAAFLARALRLTNDGGGDRFIDDDSSIFEHDIDKLAAAGITKGCNPPANTRFCPNLAVDRGAMAAFLHRADGLRGALPAQQPGGPR